MGKRLLRIGLALLFALVAIAVFKPGAGAERTPDEALESVRMAVAADDAHALFATYDRESRGFYLDRVREWRARLARGDDPAEVLGDRGLEPAAVTGVPEEQAAAEFARQFSSLLRRQAWLAGATEVGERETIGDGAELRLRLAHEGVERDIWFVREGDGWVYDHFRTDVVN